MLVTLCLISSNVYIAVDAPVERGFSYIEVWFLGMQLPILFAIVEYSFILGLNKFLVGREVNQPKAKVMMMGATDKKVTFNKENMEFLAYFLDLLSFVSSAILFVIFCFIYWVFLDS